MWNIWHFTENSEYAMESRGIEKHLFLPHFEVDECFVMVAALFRHRRFCQVTNNASSQMLLTIATSMSTFGTSHL